MVYRSEVKDLADRPIYSILPYCGYLRAGLYPRRSSDAWVEDHQGMPKMDSVDLLIIYDLVGVYRCVTVSYYQRALLLVLSM